VSGSPSDDSSSGSSNSTLDELVHRADLDGLVRLTDSLCARRDWEGLATLHTRCRAAVRTGRQLWPAATLAEYRLALWAPAQWAAPMLGEEGGRFTIGPLTEVVAQNHSFAELVPLTEHGPRQSLVAHERALRGERIEADDLLDVFDIPFEVQPWEPTYQLPTYGDDGVESPSPPRPPPSVMRRVAPARAARTIEDHAVTAAVRQLLEPWTASSNGRAEITCVQGNADAAIMALGVTNARSVAITGPEALAWLVWAGASGGAHGRRRGCANGRFGAWWLLAALGDLTAEWPVGSDELGELVASLRWFWWTAGEPEVGWELQLAVHDPLEGYAWAINARDAH
jgi:Family of unknown function (DUF6183)